MPVKSSLSRAAAQKFLDLESVNLIPSARHDRRRYLEKETLERGETGHAIAGLAAAQITCPGSFSNLRREAAGA